MHLLFLPLIGVLSLSMLLGIPATHAALPAPVPQPVISTTYVQGIFDYVKRYLDDPSVTGSPSSSCTSVKAARDEAEAARKLRSLLLDVDAAIMESEEDLARTACFRSDAEALERYLRDLTDFVLQSAASCDQKAATHYQAMADVVWKHLTALRRFGLSPTVQVPFTGTGVAGVPTGAVPEDDDELCPYHSAYAGMQFGNLGCQEGAVSSVSTSKRLLREGSIVESLRQRLEGVTGLAPQLVTLRKTMEDLLAETFTFVTSLTVKRPLGLRTITGSNLTLAPPAPNAGESGCLGWPSDVSGIVTAEGVSLQNAFPFLLTHELAETFSYLRERERDDWLEYLQVIEEEHKKEGNREQLPSSFLPDLRSINRDHLSLESFAILAIREPQQRMAKLADILHERTRAFTHFAVSSKAVTWPPPDDPLPPLRQFAEKSAIFLSRMCINRGCSAPLARSLELSLRQECFSSFLMDLFFKANPDAATLPACRALYVE